MSQRSEVWVTVSPVDVTFGRVTVAGELQENGRHTRIVITAPPPAGSISVQVLARCALPQPDEHHDFAEEHARGTTRKL